MSALLAILRPVLSLLVSAFANALVDYAKSSRELEAAKEAGRAEVMQQETTAANMALQDMSNIAEPDDDEMLTRLRMGTA